MEQVKCLDCTQQAYGELECVKGRDSVKVGLCLDRTYSNHVVMVDVMANRHCISFDPSNPLDRR